ncbi:uncharacterized protein LOC117651667 isoform X2 [Thrips palmi]|uniref:Uncharacterized protein LOC117651667 isoform X2 n=1 Tax=Thrips palmi TaxID=161013 RepID=A0A6P9A1X9_THRPL|nr:uncharacterized protein LOC117651667 isoform X2 [Thrips palmi]
MVVKRFCPCSDNDTEAQHDASTLRFSHFNPAKPYEPQTVTGTLTIPFDLDDSYWVSVRVDKRANNQWKKNYFVLNRFPVGFCSTVRTNIPEGFARVLGPKSLTGRCNVPKASPAKAMVAPPVAEFDS